MALLGCCCCCACCWHRVRWAKALLLLHAAQLGRLLSQQPGCLEAQLQPPFLDLPQLMPMLACCWGPKCFLAGAKDVLLLGAHSARQARPPGPTRGMRCDRACFSLPRSKPCRASCPPAVAGLHRRLLPLLLTLGFLALRGKITRLLL